MKRILFILFLSIASGTLLQAQVLKNLLNTVTNAANSQGVPLSQEEIANGLKEALTIGSNNASATANKVDGFYKNPKIKIPFPAEVNYAATKLREIGMGKLVDDFVLTMNRSAEKAAKEAAPIFVNAVKQMTIPDAVNILKGGDNAATEYLKRTTTTSLYSAFYPHIKTALSQTGCTKHWTKITTTYNKFALGKKVETDLTKYTTNKALEGLFYLVSQEELKIRKDPASRITEILKKVFG